MPNLKSDHHYIFQFPTRWIDKAKELRAKDDIALGDQLFESDHRWAGKIGEWAFYSVFPGMRSVNSWDRKGKHDFISSKTDIRYEVKTNSADRPFKDSFHLNVNDSQHKNNPSGVYVACYYMPGEINIHICGWLYKPQVDTRGFLVHKGDRLSNKGNVAKSDFWKVPFASLNSMHLLPG